MKTTSSGILLNVLNVDTHIRANWTYMLLIIVLNIIFIKEIASKHNFPGLIWYRQSFVDARRQPWVQKHRSWWTSTFDILRPMVPDNRRIWIPLSKRFQLNRAILLNGFSWVAENEIKPRQEKTTTEVLPIVLILINACVFMDLSLERMHFPNAFHVMLMLRSLRQHSFTPACAANGRPSCGRCNECKAMAKHLQYSMVWTNMRFIWLGFRAYLKEVWFVFRATKGMRTRVIKRKGASSWCFWGKTHARLVFPGFGFGWAFRVGAMRERFALGIFFLDLVSKGFKLSLWMILGRPW